MGLAHPWTLLLLLLGVGVVWLYGRPLPARRLETGLGKLWQEALKAEPLRAAWQPWRGPVSLAVQLLILGLVVLAAADPQIPGPRRLVVIVDNSPSMRARDVEPTRLHEARRLAKLLASGVRPVDRLAVLTAADGVRVCCAPTGEPALLAEAIESIQPGNFAQGMLPAVAIARKMLGEESGGRIVILTDGCFPDLAPLADERAVDVVLVGRPADNLAITRLAADAGAPSAGSPSGTWEVLVEVGNFADRSAACRLSLAVEGGPAAIAPVVPLELQLEPRGRVQRVFQIAADAPGRLTARVEPLGRFEDMLPEDNTRSITLAPASAAGAERREAWPEHVLPAGYDAPARSAQAAGEHGDHEQSARDLEAARQFLRQEAMILESDLRRTRFGLRDRELAEGGTARPPLSSRLRPPGAAKFHLPRTPADAGQRVAAFAGGVSLRPALLMAALLLAVVQWCLEQRRWLA